MCISNRIFCSRIFHNFSKYFSSLFTRTTNLFYDINGIFSINNFLYDFKDDICDARTYGFESDVNKLREAGFAKGGSLENAVVVSGDRVLNKEGLRYKDEFVRHKILDLLGDLYLSGHRISANIFAEKSGHSLNNKLVHEIFRQRSCWNFQEESLETPRNWQSNGLAAIA